MDAQPRQMSRRKLLKTSALSLISASAVASALETLAWKPDRIALAAPATSLPDIQFDISNFIFTSSRLEFVQVGLPRKFANQFNLPFAGRINPDSPMWMGFLDQQVDGSGPASICTFQGNASAKFTTADSSNYFFDGSLQHLSHVIQDLAQFYADDEPFTERVRKR